MWPGSTTSPERLTPRRPSKIRPALPQTARRKPIPSHEPRQSGAVLDTLSTLQIDRFQKRRHPKCHREGFPLAPATLPVLSLRPPFLPIPMASFHRGYGVSNGRFVSAGDQAPCQRRIVQNGTQWGFQIPVGPARRGGEIGRYSIFPDHSSMEVAVAISSRSSTIWPMVTRSWCA